MVPHSCPSSLQPGFDGQNISNQPSFPSLIPKTFRCTSHRGSVEILLTTGKRLLKKIQKIGDLTY